MASTIHRKRDDALNQSCYLCLFLCKKKNTKQRIKAIGFSDCHRLMPSWFPSQSHVTSWFLFKQKRGSVAAADCAFCDLVHRIHHTQHGLRHIVGAQNHPLGRGLSRVAELGFYTELPESLRRAVGF